MSVSKPDFWKKLKKPIFALAPMEDVTDTVFRELIMSVSDPGRLSLLFTEFTSVDGLCHPLGRSAVLHRLKVNKSERHLLDKLNIKLIAQIWGNDPEKFYSASKYIADEFDFDGIDINMGCPVSKVVKQNTCSALIDQPALALEIIDATIKGSGLPVSVKTRTGIKTHSTERWISQLLQSETKAITLHARTQKMQSLYPAEWEQIAIAVRVRDAVKPDVKLLGNGDVVSWDHGIKLIKESGADGAMIGRAIFSDPWLFSETQSEKSVAEKLDLLQKHIRLFADSWPSGRNFSILKRFFKIYIHGFAGAAALRASLMETFIAEDALDMIGEFRKSETV